MEDLTDIIYRITEGLPTPHLKEFTPGGRTLRKTFGKSMRQRRRRLAKPVCIRRIGGWVWVETPPVVSPTPTD